MITKSLFKGFFYKNLFSLDIFCKTGENEENKKLSDAVLCNGTLVFK
jgi:hypothetical protein